MKVDVTIDVAAVTKLANRFPRATADQIEVYTERVGRKLEREAKYAMRADQAGPNQARSRSGTLVRQIRFVKGGRLGGAVKAFAKYSQFVHGAPYHRNKRQRKENPFFTTAQNASERFIEKENRNFLKNVIKRI